MFWFVKTSLSLDFSFFKVSSWSLFRKIEFLFVKYREIFLLKMGIKKFKLGINSVRLFGRNIFYDSPYGIAGYQRMLTSHQKMLKDEGIKDLNTVIDVGANVGFFSMMIRDRFPGAKIFAIEPIPTIFDCLKKILRMRTVFKRCFPIWLIILGIRTQNPYLWK